jgi:hypothetical protein
MSTPEFADETWLATVLRATVEAIAWVGTPWAAAELLGWWAAPVAFLIVLVVPWLVMRLLPLHPADEGAVSVPGLVRVSLFIDLCVIATVAAWYLLGPTAGVFTIAIGIAAQVTGWRRSRWLLAGAPPI